MSTGNGGCWIASCVVIAIGLVIGDTTLLRADNRPVEKPDPSLAAIEDDPNLPRVLIIGDSISMGYTLPTRKLLAGKANVHRIPENGGPTSRGVENIEKWLGDGKWDVIHFNFGLHDIKRIEKDETQTSIKDYEENLRKLVKRMQETNAKLIWATTTPVPKGKMRPERHHADVVEFNEVAQKVMEENGIVIDDLYVYALPQLKKIQRPKNVHFTPSGSDVLAKQVAESIAEHLPTAKKAEATP